MWQFPARIKPSLGSLICVGKFHQKLFLTFSVLIFSDENSIAKLAFAMWRNCSNRLWYSLKTCNSFLKSLQYRCFPVNFAKFWRTSFLKNSFGQLLLDIFYLFHCFVTPWTNRNQSFSIFRHVFSWHSNVVNIMILNDLVVVSWKHTFLGDITWNLVVFLDWLVFLYVLTEFVCSTVLQLLTHATPKR